MSIDSDSPRPDGAQPAPSIADLSGEVRAFAHRLGFDQCRIAPVEEALHADFFDLWLQQGRAGEMRYLDRHAEKRRNPLLLGPRDAERYRSILVLSVNYHAFDLPVSVRDDPSRGLIASYAWSDDYHEIIRPALYEIDAFLRSRTGRSAVGKCLVDTGPVLERDWAQRAGLGFTGKNCCTIHPVDGSWHFLATVLVPERLTYDAMPRRVPGLRAAQPEPREVLDGLPLAGNFGAWAIPLREETSHKIEGRRDTGARTSTCGGCTRCLDACPTDAFVGPFHLDPHRCISYWTIEARAAIPRRLRPHFGNRIFGCDICQEVCPWNNRLPQRTPVMEGLRAQRDRTAPYLLEGFRAETPYWLDDDAFRDHFRRSPVLRAKRTGMLRNVCVALGNWAGVETVPALQKVLHVGAAHARGHAAWALGRVAARGGDAAIAKILEQALSHEPVDWVREEIVHAITGE